MRTNLAGAAARGHVAQAWLLLKYGRGDFARHAGLTELMPLFSTAVDLKVANRISLGLVLAALMR